MQGEANKLKSKIELTDRRKLVVEEVLGILTFDDTYLLLNTSCGDMYIEGDGMVIEDLNKDSKKIIIVGSINALGFNEKRTKKTKKGFLA